MERMVVVLFSSYDNFLRNNLKNPSYEHFFYINIQYDVGVQTHILSTEKSETFKVLPMSWNKNSSGEAG